MPRRIGMLAGANLISSKRGFKADPCALFFFKTNPDVGFILMWGSYFELVAGLLMGS